MLRRPAGTHLVLAAILVVALGFRLVSLRHGLPFVFNVDEEQHFVSKAARFFSGGDLDPGLLREPARADLPAVGRVRRPLRGRRRALAVPQRPRRGVPDGTAGRGAARHARRRRDLLARRATGARPPRGPRGGRIDGRRLHPRLVLEAGAQRHAGGAARDARRRLLAAPPGRGPPPRPADRRADGRPRGRHEVHRRRGVSGRRHRRRAAAALAGPGRAGRARRRRAAESLVRARPGAHLRRHAVAGRALGGGQGGGQRDGSAAVLPALVLLGARPAGGAPGDRRPGAGGAGRSPSAGDGGRAGARAAGRDLAVRPRLRPLGAAGLPAGRGAGGPGRGAWRRPVAPARPHGRDRGRARVHSRRDRQRAPGPRAGAAPTRASRPAATCSARRRPAPAS